MAHDEIAISLSSAGSTLFSLTLPPDSLRPIGNAEWMLHNGTPAGGLTQIKLHFLTDSQIDLKLHLNALDPLSESGLALSLRIGDDAGTASLSVGRKN